MNQKLIELGGKLESKRTEWMDFYKQFEAVGDQQAKDMTGEDVAKFKAYEAEVSDLQRAFDAEKSVYDAAEANRSALSEGRKVGPSPAYGRQAKGIADQAIEKGLSSKAFRGNIELADADAKAWLQGKATMTTGANGYPPEVLRDGNVVPAISRPPQLIDFLRIDPTNQNAIKFMAQTVRTNAAAAKDEGSAFDEATITYAEQTDIISKIGVYIPVTEEQLEDEPGVRTLVEQDLGLMVRQVFDEMLCVGNGTDPNLLGIYNSANIQTQAKGSDVALDAIAKAFKEIRVDGRARPNLFVMHSTDHTALALTRTADGLYILGSPTDQMVMRVWGVPIALNEALTAGNALALDTDYFRVKMRKGLTLAVSDSHSTNFIANVLVIRAHIRAGIEHLRGQAACKVTGL
jgi:HK97 family phage major capsid protein